MLAIGHDGDLHIVGHADNLIHQAVAAQAVETVADDPWQKDLSRVVKTSEVDHCFGMIAAHENTGFDVKVSSEVKMAFYRIALFGGQSIEVGLLGDEDGEAVG